MMNYPAKQYAPLRRPLAHLDALFNRLYTWRYNPLYHSGALVVACFVVLSVTGLYLLLFYRIGSPYASVERIADQAFAGRWIRSLHRYASDLAVVAALVHAFRMGVQNRAWGPRALAWLSGIVLLGVFLICGWTGYVMVWDTQAQLLAQEGARLLDVFPIFSEPIARAFAGDRAIPSAFFFLNLFAHIAIPVGILLILWIHVSRLARTELLPPRPLTWGMVGVLTVLSVAWPAVLGPEADPLRVPQDVALDLFYNFWVPLSAAVPAGVSWLALVAGLVAVGAIPWLTRPAPETVEPSWVDPRFCTGCEQCYHDCPYEAISMVARDDDRPYTVGLVDPDKCVSCGICAGSCAPMGVGPPKRAGRDQLRSVKEFITRHQPSSQDVVLVACSRSAAGWEADDFGGAPVLPVDCVGNVHTSVVEYLVRAGAGGVIVVSCPPRDCWNREGVKWMDARVYDGREAELKDRVDRTRIRVVHAAEAEGRVLAESLALFRSQIGALDRALSERAIELDTTCEQPAVSVAEEVT
ncbi:MAG: hydrogenase iron-sulfur subunit [Gemmatimonadetes bacterium]|nr:hydrogenase iron-sulfur subunit [Gemmatimonadota bacterium]NNL30271.1 hydrogenase iron-sulfur subunit [Gemmatimonadota bacterium]